MTTLIDDVSVAEGQPLVDPNIGRRIAAYRKLNGWSAERLAAETGGYLNRSQLANIESGRRDDLNLSQFLAICMALDVPLAALIVDAAKPGRAGRIAWIQGHDKRTEPSLPSSETARALLASWPVDRPSEEHALPTIVTDRALEVAEYAREVADHLESIARAGMASRSELSRG